MPGAFERMAGSRVTARVGIDARLLTYRRGIGNSVYNLLAALARLPTDTLFLLYVDDLAAADLVPRDSRFSIRMLAPRFYPVWEQISLPLAAASDGLKVLHSPANTAPISVAESVKLLVTVHDVMYLMPRSLVPASSGWYQRLGRAYRSWIVPQVVKRAHAVVAVSERCRRDIEEYVGLPADRITVVHEAANSACRVLDDPEREDEVRLRYGLSRPFILALGASDPRKNTGRILEAFALVRRAGFREMQLAIVGAPAGGHAQLRDQARALGVLDDVSVRGFVPEHDLVALYNAAEVFVYPSLYEGFGLPVLEAMACGTPVVSSAAGSIPEIAGDAVSWIDPYSAESISRGIRGVLEAPGLASRLRAIGLAQANRFSWEQTAKKMLDLYEQASA
jgi:glycosyltransferase involved in cell wall biosynthesis